MRNESPFKTLKSEKITIGRFEVVEDVVEVNGKICPYDYLEMKEGVSILPFTGDKVVTLRQYRYPIRSWQRELPGGLIDPGEEPLAAAVRELQEETGYRVERIEPLGDFYPSFGSTNERIHLFYAVCGEHGEDHKDAAEVLNLEEIPVKEFEKEIASGEFRHGAGLAAWARYCAMREKLNQNG